MERIHSGSLQDYKAAIAHFSVSSGNVQLLPVHHGEGIENQYPLPEGQGGKRPSHFPVPSIKLGSNDSTIRALDTKISRHALRPPKKKLVDPDRPYLVHPKYIDYRSRPRQDIGKDGNPIWPDHIEAAFQDALVHIRPMGRKKCSQHGKPFGRNMLIAEWIKRATGHHRERKQVSSHIQVLDRFLSGIPEWDRLVKPCDDDESDSNEGHKFYHNSIEHMVQEHKARHKSGHVGAGWDDDLDDIDDDSSLAEAHSHHSWPIDRLNFDMWVSSPADQDFRFHDYTGLQSSKLPSMALEDVPGWRLTYPRLKSLVESTRQLKGFDIVLLDTSFKLMGDFPPRQSKLGISLELQFPSSMIPSDVHYDKWTCTTYLYQEGVLISQPIREPCHVPKANGASTDGPNQLKIRPSFQPKWWASKFTSLTEGKKIALESHDPAAVELATAESRAFFQGLTVMQEITALRFQHSQDFGYAKRDRWKRMAILLWRFSEASEDQPGTTTWQNLVAPPTRSTTNSPLPMDAEMDLPHLSMDSIVSPGGGSFDQSNHFLSQHGITYEMYQDGMDDELCQDGFVGLKPEGIHDFGHGPHSLDHSFSTIDPSVHHSFQTNVPQQSAAANVFDVSNEHHDLSLDSHFQDNGKTGDTDEGHPLSRFDTMTHQVLQEQLNAAQNPPPSRSPPVKSEHSPDMTKALPMRTWSQQIDDDERMLHYLAAAQQQQHHLSSMPEGAAQQAQGEWSPSFHNGHDHDDALRNAFMAASAMGDLSNPALASQTPRSLLRHEKRPSKNDLSQHWASPLTIRPALQSYHSFPGMRSEDFMIHHDNPAHQEHELATSQPVHHYLDDGAFGNQISATSAPADFMHAHDEAYDHGARGLSRAHSEPDPMIMDMSVLHGFSPDRHVGCSDNDMDGQFEGHEQTHRASDGDGRDMGLGGSFVEVSMEGIAA